MMKNNQQEAPSRFRRLFRKRSVRLVMFLAIALLLVSGYELRVWLLERAADRHMMLLYERIKNDPRFKGVKVSSTVCTSYTPVGPIAIRTSDARVFVEGSIEHFDDLAELMDYSKELNPWSVVGWAVDAKDLMEDQ